MMNSPKDKILLIIDRLGISTAVAAKAMFINENTFRKNKSDTLPRNNFTEKNFNDLLNFLIDELGFLIELKDMNSKLNMSLEEVISAYLDVFKNYSKYSKNENWNLFDELKKIVDNMEVSDVFKDDDLYTKIIDEILFECVLKGYKDSFTIEKYKEYISNDNSNTHERWYNYIIRRRQRTIMDILNS